MKVAEDESEGGMGEGEEGGLGVDEGVNRVVFGGELIADRAEDFLIVIENENGFVGGRIAHRISHGRRKSGVRGSGWCKRRLSSVSAGSRPRCFGVRPVRRRSWIGELGRSIVLGQSALRCD